MIDLHSHILPNVDDGPRTIEESREIARSAVADGIVEIAATPHVRGDWPTDAATMEDGVAGLRADFADCGIPIRVLHGGEVALDRLPALDPDELERFTLAQTGVYLLLEMPYGGWPLALASTVAALTERGIVAVLAHPERNPDVQSDVNRLAQVVEAGALVQVTAASLEGRLGRSARAAAVQLLERGIVHAIASDAHAPGVRQVGLRAAAEAVGDRGLARYLTEEAPAAIVAGEPVGAPPPMRRRRRFGVF